ncbi:MAG: tRNA pseudouridine(55) synthase TruB [Cyanobacteria bacterium REEB65]|nr:tRNA pseudouridine(55) synthase TruB [Cyanobacteria bacterium REEB65]
MAAGFYNVLKPPGMTAHDVVSFARKKLETKRIGHAGTLDPLAAGVLPLAVGAFTRLLPYLAGDKTYRAEIAFGRATTTGDAAGHTIAEGPVDFDERKLRQTLARFVGHIEQRPPSFSAVHVEGRRAYELARAGQAVEIPPRTVEIVRLDLLRCLGNLALLEVDCSAGTYVRSLAVDIGKAIGTPAHLAFLLRTRSGGFALDSAIPLDEPWQTTPIGTVLGHLAVKEVSGLEASDVRMGRSVAAVEPEGTARAMCAGQIVAVGQIYQGAFWPKTVLPPE